MRLFTRQKLSKYLYFGLVFVIFSVCFFSNLLSPALAQSPPNPQWIAKTPVLGEVKGVAFSGNNAFVASKLGLQIVDASNPAKLLVKSSLTMSNPMAVAVSGNYAYVSDFDANGKYIKVVDISDLTKPSLVTTATLTIPDYAVDLTISGTKLYVAAYGAGLIIFDITSPAAPSILGTLDTPGTANAVAVSNNLAVVADASAIRTINIATPASPSLLGSLLGMTNATDVTINGSYAYVADGAAGVRIVDLNLSNPALPQLKSTAPPRAFGHIMAVAYSSNYIYASIASGELQIFDVNNVNSPSEAGFLSMAGQNGYGMALRSGVVALPAGAGGIVTINVANPSSPSLFDRLPPIASAKDLAVSGSYLYALKTTPSGFGGSPSLEIYNISDPYSPVHTGRLSLEVPLAIVVNNGYAYVGDGKNIKVINVQNPASPFLVVTLPILDYAVGLTISGTKLYVAAYGAGLIIFDIATNPAAPSQKGTCDTPGTAYGVAVSNNLAVVADYSSIQTIDVTNQDSPSSIGSLATTGSRFFNVAINGSYAYVADGSQVVGVGGVRIVDIFNPVLPRLVSIAPVKTFAWISDVTYAGNYIYAASTSDLGSVNGLQIFNILDLASPQEVKFLASSGGRNTALALAGNFAYITDDKYLVDIADLGGAKLTVTKSADKTSVTHGNQITYTLVVNNPSTTDTMTSLKLTDPIPALTTYAPGSATYNGQPVTDVQDGDNYTLVTGVPTWNNIPSIAPSATITVSFKVNVN